MDNPELAGQVLGLALSLFFFSLLMIVFAS
jgi:hypothetical protein